MDKTTGQPRVTPLPHVTEPPRYLGHPFAPGSLVQGSGPWRGEWVFTQPLPSCTMTILAGSSAVRRYNCATVNGSALVTWDGKGSQGAPVGAGAYTWQLNASGADGPAVDEDGHTGPITGTVVVHGFDADGYADVLARQANGDLMLYRGNGTGGFGFGPGIPVPSRIGAGWQYFTALFSAGDFTGDGHPDLLARKTNGDLILYRGNGLGGFTGAGQKIGAGWQYFTALFSPGDFTGDGHPDLLARKTNGDLILYRGNGTGGFTGTASKVTYGWQGYTALVGVG